MKKALISRIIKIGFLINLLAVGSYVHAQTCTSNPTTIANDINFSAISWTASGGATVAQCNAMATGTAFTGNVVLDLANNKTVTVTTDLNITGNFDLGGGAGSILSVTGGHTVHVYGTSNSMGDIANNGIQYNVASTTDKIIVDGTLYGKNNNAFTGNGSISGGTLNVKNGSTCGNPCPVSGGFSNCTAGDAFCTSYGALPIELLYFNASLEGSAVKLNWATSLEENFDRFIVQRSANGKQFESLGDVAGVGSNVHNIENDYSFIDGNPKLGLNYYRLKALDLDGSFELYKTVAVDFSGNKKVWVNQNPSTGEGISFSTNFDASQSDNIVLIDNLGKEIKRGGVSQLNGQVTFDSSVTPGVYLLKYFTDGTALSTRIVVK
jgi:hypothetical protein